MVPKDFMRETARLIIEEMTRGNGLIIMLT
jgi:hypothetical protein